MNAWIQVTAWTIIHFLWQGALLAVATEFGLHLYRERSSRARYAIACGGLAAMLAVAALTAAVLTTYGSFPVPQTNLRPQVYAAPESAFPELGTAIEEQSTFSTGAAPATVVDAALPYIVWSWVAGVIALLTRFCLGCLHIRRLRGVAERAADSPWQAAARVLAECLRMTTAFRVVESAIVHAPTVLGWLQPVVLLPVAALTNLTPARLRRSWRTSSRTSTAATMW